MSAVYVIAAELNGRFRGRPERPLIEMMACAAEKALDSAGVQRGEVDAIYAGTMGNFDPEGYVGPIPIRLANSLGLRNADVTPLLVGSSEAGAWALMQAYQAMRRSSSLDTILVLAGEQMNPVETPSTHTASFGERKARNQAISDILDEKERHYGLNMVRMGDLLMDLICHAEGWTEEQLKNLFLPLMAMTKYERVCAYPLAHLYGKVEPILSKYQNRPRLTPYFNLDDVTPTSSGATAVVLSTQPSTECLEICGMGQAFDPISMASREGSLALSSSVSLALERACRDANVDRHWLLDSDFAVLHDAFPSIEYAFLKALKLDPLAILDSATSGWSNPFGGLKTCGHALGASGLLQIAKAYHRVFRRADYLSQSAVDNLKEARHCFATSVGGPLTNVVVSILRRHENDSDHPAKPLGELDEFSRSSNSVDPVFEQQKASIPLGCGWILARTQIYHNSNFGDDEIPLFTTVRNPWVYLVERAPADSATDPKAYAYSAEPIDVGSVVSTSEVLIEDQTYLKAGAKVGEIERCGGSGIDAKALGRFEQRLAKMV